VPWSLPTYTSTTEDLALIRATPAQDHRQRLQHHAGTQSTLFGQVLAPVAQPIGNGPVAQQLLASPRDPIMAALFTRT
jgi:hypothetical protein